MINTYLIPILVGLVCCWLANVSMNFILPLLPIDDAIKGIIKLFVLVLAFTGPGEYLRKKAVEKAAQKKEP